MNLADIDEVVRLRNGLKELYECIRQCELITEGHAALTEKHTEKHTENTTDTVLTGAAHRLKLTYMSEDDTNLTIIELSHVHVVPEILSSTITVCQTKIAAIHNRLNEMGIDVSA